MVNRPPPEEYNSLAAWLKEVVKGWPSKAEFAREAKISAQLLEKWLLKTVPGDGNLKKLATATHVEYRALKLLASGVEPAAAPPGKELATKTELGAIVGRKWEELREQNDVAAMNILGVIETLVTLQRDSYRRYANDQQARVAKRGRERRDATHRRHFVDAEVINRELTFSKLRVYASLTPHGVAKGEARCHVRLPLPAPFANWPKRTAHCTSPRTSPTPKRASSSTAM